MIQTGKDVNTIHNLEENLTLLNQIKLSYKTQHWENALQIYRMHPRWQIFYEILSQTRIKSM